MLAMLMEAGMMFVLMNTWHNTRVEQGVDIGNQWFICITILVKNLNMKEGIKDEDDS
jgi:hypothetical protein